VTLMLTALQREREFTECEYCHLSTVSLINASALACRQSWPTKSFTSLKFCIIAVHLLLVTDYNDSRLFCKVSILRVRVSRVNVRVWVNSQYVPQRHIGICWLMH